MKARYFRLMYQNVTDGILHTASFVNTEEKKESLIYYLCPKKGGSASDTLKYDALQSGNPADGEPSSEEKEDERFAMRGKKITYLVLADFGGTYPQKLMELVKNNRVEHAFLPGGDEDFLNEWREWLEKEGVDAVHILNRNEKYEEKTSDYEVRISCLGSGSENSLVMYHGPLGVEPKTDDCVLTVKPALEDLPCSICVDAENHGCGMRCGLYNDYDMCKGHNGIESEGYVLGTLLLGNLNLRDGCEEKLDAFTDKKKKVRFVTLPQAGNEAAWNSEIADWTDHGHKSYYLCPKGEGQEEPMAEILQTGIRHTPVVLSESSGLCASGFFTKRA